MNRLFSKIYWNFVLLGVFGIAMGILEAIVVVYLRQIYYPQGFDFPLTLLSREMVFLEWIREITTLVMLGALGMIAGKDYLQRFLCFLYTFAVWDIFYYVGLKLFLNWPSSFGTFDVLFLIPVPWIGPVLAPLLCSLTMILFASILLVLQERGHLLTIKSREWKIIFFGAFVIFCSFTRDYFRIIILNGVLSGFGSLSQNDHFLQRMAHYKPTDYHWGLFAFGELLIVYAFTQVLKRTKTISTEGVASE